MKYNLAAQLPPDSISNDATHRYSKATEDENVGFPRHG